MASVQAIPDFEVLKEPRGLLRFLSHFFLLTGLLRNISQSSTVVVRSSGVLNSLSLFDSPHSEAHLHCQGVRSNTTWPNHSTNLLPIQVGALSFEHPSSGNHRNWSVDSIRLDTDRQTWKYREMCGLKDVQKDGGSLYDLKFPGNFSSDAEFFVFTGVFAWLYCFLRSGKLLTWISRWLKQYYWLYIFANPQPGCVRVLQSSLHWPAEKLSQGEKWCNPSTYSGLNLSPGWFCAHCLVGNVLVGGLGSMG